MDVPCSRRGERAAICERVNSPCIITRLHHPCTRGTPSSAGELPLSVYFAYASMFVFTQARSFEEPRSSSFRNTVSAAVTETSLGRSYKTRRRLAGRVSAAALTCLFCWTGENNDERAGVTHTVVTPQGEPVARRGLLKVQAF